MILKVQVKAEQFVVTKILLYFIVIFPLISCEADYS